MADRGTTVHPKSQLHTPRAAKPKTPALKARNGQSQTAADIPFKTILRAFMRNAFWILVIVVPAYLLIRFLVGSPVTNGIFYPLQAFEASCVAAISAAFGIQATRISAIDIEYNQPLPDGALLAIRVGPDCTGIMEMVFLVALILAVVDCALRTRLKWSIILASVLFIENIARMVLNYPIAVSLGGLHEWLKFHDFWFRYGQLVFVMILFFLWYWFSARKSIPMPTMDSNPSLRSARPTVTGRHFRARRDGN